MPNGCFIYNEYGNRSKSNEIVPDTFIYISILIILDIFNYVLFQKESNENEEDTISLPLESNNDQNSNNACKYFKLKIIF